MINLNKLKGSKYVEVVYFVSDNIDGKYVKKLREEKGLTQTALANILGVTKKTIEKWEQGKNKVTGSSAVLLTLLKNENGFLDKLYKVDIRNDYSTYKTFAKIEGLDISQVDESYSNINAKGAQWGKTKQLTSNRLVAII